MVREDGETPLQLLDRYRVDLFVGEGLPRVPPDTWSIHTTAHLARAPGWVPVFRAVDQAVYLRRSPRNDRNLERVAAYYTARGIPFDPSEGLDVAAAIDAKPAWAKQLRVLPHDYERLIAASGARDPALRFRALTELAAIHALLGSHARALELDEQASDLQPDAAAPRRRKLRSEVEMKLDDGTLVASGVVSGMGVPR